MAAWFDPHSGVHCEGGLALLCGAVSGGFEALDFDVASAYDEWVQLLERRGSHSLLRKLSLTRTPRPGVHVGLRSAHCGRNQRLATRPVGQPPFRSDRVILCETRGEGGYVLAPGCPPAATPAAASMSPLPTSACR